MHSDPRTWPLVPKTTGHPDHAAPVAWRDMAARLAALSESRMAQAHARNFASSRGNASFDANCARLVGAFDRATAGDETVREYDYPSIAHGINRVDSGRGKTRSAITGNTAGIDTTGDRGLK